MGSWPKWKSRNGWEWVVQYYRPSEGKLIHPAHCGYRGGPHWQHVFAPRRRGPWRLDQAMQFLHTEKEAQTKRMAALGKPLNTTYRLYNVDTKEIIMGDIL